MSSGIYNLGDATISAAVTNSVITNGTSESGEGQAFIDGLEWMAGVTLQANFTAGGGGTSVKADVETSLDGVNWIAIARFAFTTSSALKVMNVSGLTPKTSAATPGTLSDDTALDGCLGDRLRARITTTGTYSGNSAISVRATVR